MFKRFRSKKPSDSGSKPTENVGGCILTLTPIVVEIVFRYLNARELNVCGKVCTVWQRTAEIVKRRRQEPLVVFETASLVQPEGKRDKFNSAGLIETFKSILRESYSPLSFGIVFCCNVEPDDVRTIETSLGVGNGGMSNFCISYYRLAALLGISGAVRWPEEKPHLRLPALSALFFPQHLPGVKFYPFKILEEFPPTSSSSDLIPNATKIPKGERIKCLLIFKASPFYIVRSNLLLDPARSIMNYYMERNDSRLAIGGTQAGFTHFIHSTSVPSEDGSPRYIGVGLAIGGDLFESASITLTPDVTTKEQVLDKLVLLQEGIRLRQKTYALLFTSSKIGKQQCDGHDVVSVCFQEIFPNVPLIGMKSHGMFNTREIIGITYLPEMELGSQTYDSYIHNHSTVIVILTWGVVPAR